MTIDIERLKREYRAVCNKCCINPDEGPATSFEVALARGELAKARKRQTRYTYSDWERLSDEAARWMQVVGRISPGGYCYIEAAIWSKVVAQVRRAHPHTAEDVEWLYGVDALVETYDDLVREVLHEERDMRRDQMTLRELQARQRERGLEVTAPSFITV